MSLTQQSGLTRQLTLILSEMEDVLDLRVSRVFSSRKLLSSKLEPIPESEHEIQRERPLQLTLVITSSDVHQPSVINGNNYIVESYLFFYFVGKKLSILC